MTESMREKGYDLYIQVARVSEDKKHLEEEWRDKQQTNEKETEDLREHVDELQQHVDSLTHRKVSILTPLFLDPLPGMGHTVPSVSQSVTKVIVMLDLSRQKMSWPQNKVFGYFLEITYNI